jgi:cytochrome c oxidase subunit 2
MFWAQVPLFPDQASTYAVQVDALYFFLVGLSAFFTLLIAGLILFFIVKYRRRPGEAASPPQIHGALRLELFWTIVPLLICLFVFVWSARLYLSWAEPPPGALEVYVVGRQWMWHLQHASGQREINQLHVPRGQPVKLTFTSKDVIHSFFVPEFRLHMDVVPGRYTTAWFQATKTGRFHLYCSQYCGTNHSAMIGEVIVLEPEEFARWRESQADESLALKGRKLFLKLQCVVCHSGDAQARAPVLEGLYRRKVTLQDGSTVIADDDYLRESILQPDAKIVAGYQRPSLMPSYEGLISEEELLQLLAFLRTLGPGQTPPRVEAAEPPASRRPPDSRPSAAAPQSPQNRSAKEVSP